jgi:hypothetical protein
MIKQSTIYHKRMGIFLNYLWFRSRAWSRVLVYVKFPVQTNCSYTVCFGANEVTAEVVLGELNCYTPECGPGGVDVSVKV